MRSEVLDSPVSDRSLSRLVLIIDGCDPVAALDRCVLSRYFVGILMFLVEVSEKGGGTFGPARESEWIVGVD